LFGEDQARYLIACNFDCAEYLMTQAGRTGIQLAAVGRFHGDTLRIGSAEASMAELSALYLSAFEAAVG
jgi:hypothetical protein